MAAGDLAVPIKYIVNLLDLYGLGCSNKTLIISNPTEQGSSVIGTYIYTSFWVCSGTKPPLDDVNVASCYKQYG